MNDQGLIKDKYEILIKEFQTIITFLYVLLIIIGMIFSNYKYEVYGINIFEYSTIFDFLITPFKDLTIIIYSLISIVLVVLIVFLPQYINKRRNKENKINKMSKLSLKIRESGFYLIIMIIGGGYLFYNYTSSITKIYAKRNKKNILTQSDLVVKLNTDETIKGKFIGKTENYIFIYKNDDVIIIPTSSFVKILKNQNKK